MLPAWSRKLIPLVFIILRYGLLRLLFENPLTWAQGADMSLRTTSTVRSFCFPFSSLAPSIVAVELSDKDCKTVVSLSAMICPASSAGGVGKRGRPRLGSRTNSKTYSWMSGERKLPWIVDTPFGGWAGIISTPRTRPLGFVRVTATYNFVISK